MIHEIPLCDNRLPHIFQGLGESDERALPTNTVNFVNFVEKILLVQYFLQMVIFYQSPVVDGVDVDVDELDAKCEALAYSDPVHLRRIVLK